MFLSVPFSTHCKSSQKASRKMLELTVITMIRSDCWHVLQRLRRVVEAITSCTFSPRQKRLYTERFVRARVYSSSLHVSFVWRLFTSCRRSIHHLHQLNIRWREDYSFISFSRRRSVLILERNISPPLQSFYCLMGNKYAHCYWLLIATVPLTKQPVDQYNIQPLLQQQVNFWLSNKQTDNITALYLLKPWKIPNKSVNLPNDLDHDALTDISLGHLH